MTQTAMLNAILSRKIKEGVAKHVSGTFTAPGQLWATSSHRMNYDNAMNLLVEDGGMTPDLARTVLETLMGSNQRPRAYYYVTVSETKMKLAITATIADHTAAGTINTDGFEFDLDELGHIIATDVPDMKPVRPHDETDHYFVFHLPHISIIMGKKKVS